MPPISEQLNLPYEFRTSSETKYKLQLRLCGRRLCHRRGRQGKGHQFARSSRLKNNNQEYEALLYRAGFRLKVALPREMALLNLVRKAIERGAHVIELS